MSQEKAPVGTPVALQVGGRRLQGRVSWPCSTRAKGVATRFAGRNERKPIVDETSLCSLRDLFGTAEACPGTRCSFWVDAPDGCPCQLEPVAEWSDRLAVESFLRAVRSIVEDSWGRKERFSYAALDTHDANPGR